MAEGCPGRAAPWPLWTGAPRSGAPAAGVASEPVPRDARFSRVAGFGSDQTPAGESQRQQDADRDRDGVDRQVSHPCLPFLGRESSLPTAPLWLFAGLSTVTRVTRRKIILRMQGARPGSPSDDGLLEKGTTLHDALEAELAHVERTVCPVQDQFGDAAAHRRRLLQAVSREAVAEEEVCDLRMRADDGVSGRACCRRSGRPSRGSA